MTRAEFVEQVFYDSGYAVGAQIIGFNLPFDVSRLAIRHGSARRSMRGGFSLTLSEREGRPAVAVKHLSQRAAMIRFTGTRPEEGKAEIEDLDPDAPHESEQKADADRGYFVDVKTLAAALTSQSHSLESLSELLNVPTPKDPSEKHGGPLTEDYTRYGLRDVQTTWECFDTLAKRFETFGLQETGLYDLYSEASLGKAYLKAMNIKPWREVQPNFPPKIIGHILSTYYGGRAEVHIRRQIVPVIHCDFLSMYPTVCTLMGLWDFVRAKGVSNRDDTEEVRQLVAAPRETLVERLRHKEGWRDLTTLVQVLPDRDLFPVRAQYPESETATIGRNYLSAPEPLWLTLADVLASKILTGRTPKMLSSLRFNAMEKQDGLRPIAVAGEMIDPATDDFYQRLIIHRNAIKTKAKKASETEKPALESDQQGVKILANATSYGIFVKLNIEDYVAAKPMIGYGVRPQAFKFKSKKFEKPGRYFHPLLGTLITGGKDGDLEALDPPSCVAVSAKRYVLFNRQGGSPAARLMLALAEHSTLGKLRKGVRISDKSLFPLVQAAEQLRHETEPVESVNAKWLQKARDFLSLVGSQNKLAKLLGVSRPYLGRVLRGEKPMTTGMIERLRAIRI